MENVNNCGQRAFRAGLRYCGRLNPVPDLPTTELLRIYAAAYGLKFTRLGEPFHCTNDPVLVVYEEKRKRDAPPPTYHAVFLSDAGPFADFPFWNVELIIYGWDGIRPVPLIRRILRKIWG